MTELLIQRQTWSDNTRYIIMTQHSSVLLEIYPTPRGDERVKAYIWALWVDEDYRLKGFAKELMNKAEEIARQAGEKAVWLEWHKSDTPVEVLQWYERMGYQEVAFTPGKCSLLKKDLI